MWFFISNIFFSSAGKIQTQKNCVSICTCYQLGKKQSGLTYDSDSCSMCALVQYMDENLRIRFVSLFFLFITYYCCFALYLYVDICVCCSLNWMLWRLTTIILLDLCEVKQKYQNIKQIITFRFSFAMLQSHLFFILQSIHLIHHFSLWINNINRKYRKVLSHHHTKRH